MTDSETRAPKPHGVADRRSSEMQKMAEPISKAIGGFLRWLHWPILALVILYFASGITTVKSDEVALVLRFGKLVGETPALAVRQPGILFAFPSPIDEIVRVKVKKIHELEIDDLASPVFRADLDAIELSAEDRIDPTVLGYCLTGDQNILHVMMTVKYQVSDPVDYALHHEDPHRVLRDAVMASVAQTIGEMPVNDAINRINLPEMVRRRSQEILDQTATGMSLVSIEFQNIFPPDQVLGEFLAVQEAFIRMQQVLREGEKYKRIQYQDAQAKRNTMLREADMFASRVLAEARGESKAFDALVKEFKAHPAVVGERVYRESLEAALAAVSRRRFVPPPMRDQYKELRITVSASR